MVKESIYIGFKLIQVIEIQDGCHIYVKKIPPTLDNGSLKNSNSVKIRFTQRVESKYEILKF